VIKLEAIDSEHFQLEHKFQMHKSFTGGIGIPSLYWFGTECKYNVLVIECLGLSLKDIFNQCNTVLIATARSHALNMTILTTWFTVT
jgi:hypothetical protein